MPRRPILACLLALALSAPLPAAGRDASPRLELSPPEWKLGMILQGTVVRQDLAVTNREPAAVTVTLVPTCDCVAVTPAVQRIEPGARATFHLSYDSTFDRGITTRSFLLRTDVPGAPPQYYLVRGVVREQRAAPPAAGTGGKQP